MLTHHLSASCHPPPWHPPLLTKVGRGPHRPGTHSRGAWARCRCCPLGPVCCRRAGPSPGSNGSSDCCCKPGARAGQRRQHPGELWPPIGPAASVIMAEEPQNPRHTYPVAVALLPTAFCFEERGVPALPLEANL